MPCSNWVTRQCQRGQPLRTWQINIGRSITPQPPEQCRLNMPVNNLITIHRQTHFRACRHTSAHTRVLASSRGRDNTGFEADMAMLQPLQCLRQVHHAEHAGFSSGPSMSCGRALMGGRRRPHYARNRSDQSSWLEQALPRAIAHRLYLLHPPARTTVLRTHDLFNVAHTRCVFPRDAWSAPACIKLQRERNQS